MKYRKLHFPQLFGYLLISFIPKYTKCTYICNEDLSCGTCSSSLTYCTSCLSATYPLIQNKHDLYCFGSHSPQEIDPAFAPSPSLIPKHPFHCCVDTCPNNYLWNPTTSECESCSISCGHCIESFDLTKCLSCSNGGYYVSLTHWDALIRDSNPSGNCVSYAKCIDSDGVILNPERYCLLDGICPPGRRIEKENRICNYYMASAYHGREKYSLGIIGILFFFLAFAG